MTDDIVLGAPRADHDFLSRLELRTRYALAAALASRRRVLDLGLEASGPDARCLLALQNAGARRLAALAPSLDGLRKELRELGAAAIEVRAAALPLPFDNGAFDLLICFDLLERQQRDDRWLAEARRVLARDGTLIVAVRGPKGSVLAELGGSVAGVTTGPVEQAYARLAESFGRGVAFGQSPLVGSMFFDFEVEDLEPEIDRSLLEADTEDPGWYVLVFGAGAEHSDKLTFVQLPFPEVAASVRAASDADREVAARRIDTLTLELETERAEITHQRSEIEQQRGELRALRDERDELVQELAGARTVTEQLADNARALRDELDARDAAGVTAERLAALDEQLRALGRERDELRAQLAAERDATRVQMTAKAQELEHVDAQLDEAHELLQTAREANEQAERERISLRMRVSEIEAALWDEKARGKNTEAALAESRARVEELEAQLAQQLAAFKKTFDERTFSLEAKAGERISILQATIDERSGELDIARDLAHRLAKQLEERRAAATGLEVQLMQARDELTERTQEIEALRRRVSNTLQEGEQKLAEAIAARDAEVFTLEARRVRDLEAARRELEGHLSAAKTAAEAQVAAANSAAQAELARHLAERDEREDALIRERDEAIAELEATQAAAAEQERTREARAVAEAELAKLRAEYEDRVDRIERELDRHRSDRASLEAQLADLLQESAERNDAQAKLQNLLEQLRTQHMAELEAIREQLERERMTTVEANEALRQERVRGEQLLARLLQLENEQQSLD